MNRRKHTRTRRPHRPPPRPQVSRNWEHYFLIGLLLLSVFGVYRLLQPYLHAIILGGLVASICYPFHGRVRQRFETRENLAAFVTSVLVAMIALVPIAIACMVLVFKTIDAFRTLQEWIDAGTIAKAIDTERFNAIVQSPPIQRLIAFQKQVLPDLDLTNIGLADKLGVYTENLLNYLGGQVVPLISNVFVLLLNTVIMLVSMFYFFREGDRIMDFLRRLCPLSETNERHLLDRIKAVGRSALLGTILTAGMQGCLAMIGFAFVGFEWFIWGILCMFAALIPVVGTGLVWMPCVIYLHLVDRNGAALALFVYCAGVVSLSDNLLRPILMSGHDTGLSSLLLFFAIIGGIQLFGLIGVIYGPLIFGICAVLLFIYDLENGPTRPAGRPPAR